MQQCFLSCSFSHNYSSNDTDQNAAAPAKYPPEFFETVGELGLEMRQNSAYIFNLNRKLPLLFPKKI